MLDIQRKIGVSLLVGLLSVSILGGLASAQDTYTIGFVPGQSTNPFYISMQYGAVQAGKDLGVNVIWQGSPEWDVAKQTAIVDSLVARGVDALVLSPTDADALKQPLKQAVDAGVTVITTDTDINDPDAAIRLVGIASDNYQGGVMAGEALAKAIKGSGQVAILSALEGVTTNEQRVKGFRDAVSNYPNIEVVSIQYSHDDQATASQQMQSVLIAHPNLVGAFAIDTPTAHGAALGIQSAGAKGNVTLVGFDSQPLEITDVKQGLITMLVTQAPYAMGYLGVQIAYDVLNGYIQSIPGHQIRTGFYVIDSKNVDYPETQKWVYQTEPPK